MQHATETHHGRGRWRAVAALAGSACMVMALAACAHREVPPPPPPPPEAAAQPTPSLQTFTATAYTIEGKTASGTHTRDGVVAADPKVLPIGSRIRITDAGQYSGVYVVSDTGRAIHGRELDIYIANNAEAKRFGKKQVQVEVLQHGEGRGSKPAVSEADGAKP